MNNFLLRGAKYFEIQSRLMLLLGLFYLSSLNIDAQNTATLSGQVTDEKGEAIVSVTVVEANNTSIGTTTDVFGNYQLSIPANQQLQIQFRFVGRKTKTETVFVASGGRKELNVVLIEDVNALDEFVVNTQRTTASLTKIDLKSIEQLPSPIRSIEAILKTLGFVSSNNELSSQYSVRGGNYDENLVYVNDFEIYRPFLIRSGQQEGLSFINPDMVRSIAFSAGGFEAKYGDKMSSVLDVEYKRPKKFGASVEVSLLGASAHVEGSNPSGRLTWVMGSRYQSNQYLLNSLPTQGQYRPRFTDYQGFVTYELSPNLQLQLIGNYASNTFNFVPVSSETSFGTFNESLSLRVFFDGQERDQYRTLMGGAGLVYRSDDNRLTLKWLNSAYDIDEREAFDIIGQYWVGEVESNFGDEDFGEISRILGVGTYHDWARNQINTNIINTAHRGYFNQGKHFLSWGAKYQNEQIKDDLNEWYRLDSAGFSIPLSEEAVVLTDVLKTGNTLNSNRITGFVQDELNLGGDSSRLSMVGGVRFNYWDLNKEFLVSPRVQFAYQADVKDTITTSGLPRKEWLLRFSTGAYFQPAFYRELRNFRGEINTDLSAQKSIHAVLGSDYTFRMLGGRPFKLTNELYYKYLWDLVPYNLDNLLIRYFGENQAKGDVIGLDSRLHGEFVKGIDSWISMSVLRAREDLEGDHYFTYTDSTGMEIFEYQRPFLPVDSSRTDIGFVPRPTDQRVNFGMFFQDYFPNNENFKMHLMLLFGTGLPFSPLDGSPRIRNQFRIPPYRRVDIGFSALLFDKNGLDKDGTPKELPAQSILRNFNSIWASIEIFNLLGVSNTVSYTWIKALSSDLQSERIYAVPNLLTSRRVNARVVVKF